MYKIYTRVVQVQYNLGHNHVFKMEVLTPGQGGVARGNFSEDCILFRNTSSLNVEVFKLFFNLCYVRE